MAQEKIVFERGIGVKLKKGFFLMKDTEDIGQITDVEKLENIPTAPISFVRVIDEIVQNGVYLRKENGGHKDFLDMLFRSEQTGLFADKEIFYDANLNRGEKMRIMITPIGEKKLRFELEIL